MKLYYSKGACSLADRIIIHEIGLKCEFESVNLQTKKTANDEDFFKINPKGYVPALAIDKNTILTENIAIQVYLAETNKAHRLLPPSGINRYRVLEWLAYISTEVHKSFGPLFNPSFDEKIKNEIFIPMLKKKFLFIENQLGHKKFLMGNDFTLPDAYLFVILFWAEHMKLDTRDCPQLNRYYNELKSRPSIQQSLEEEHLK